MLNFFKKKQEQLEYRIFNIEITRKKIPSHLKEYDKTSQFIGEFMVTPSGKLIRGIDHKVHTYETELGYSEDHIHLPKGRIIDIVIKDKQPYLKAEFNQMPRFKLDSFYSSYCSESDKLISLEEQIKQFNPKFQFDSIAIRKETRLKLLENAYRRYVSDQ